MKNTDKQVEYSINEDVPIKGHSLLETLYKHEEHRGGQNKHTAYQLSQQNHQ
jgi:hypothetical protein